MEFHNEKPYRMSIYSGKIYQILIQISFYLVLKNIGIGGFAETDTEPKHTLTDTEYSAAETGIGRSLFLKAMSVSSQFIYVTVQCWNLSDANNANSVLHLPSA